MCFLCHLRTLSCIFLIHSFIWVYVLAQLSSYSLEIGVGDSIKVAGSKHTLSLSVMRPHHLIKVSIKQYLTSENTRERSRRIVRTLCMSVRIWCSESSNSTSSSIQALNFRRRIENKALIFLESYLHCYSIFVLLPKGAKRRLDS